MTETQKRRQDLLSQTRRMYQEQYAAPAIHPRYGNIYHNLYDTTKDTSEKQKSRMNIFYIRIIVSLMIFALYAGMDIQGITIGTYSSEEIVEAVSQNIVVEKVLDSW